MIRQSGQILAIGLAMLAGPVRADAPVIEVVVAVPQGSGWRLDVTISHSDTGWDHYADGWEVLAPDGTSLGLRVLTHPHETEQPFTRSLDGVGLPDGTTEVLIRARCSVDGWSAGTTRVSLP